MVIPRYDNCNSIAFSVICVGFALRVLAGAPGTMPAPMRVSTCNSPPVLTSEEAKRAIDPLVRALSTCRDDAAACHLRYRIGVIHFKAGMMAQAAACFEQIAGASQTPELIQACSLNMAGQIARRQGDGPKAIDAFGRLAGLAKRLLTAESEDTSDTILRTLWCAALVGRAEIYELQKDPAAAAQEYQRLLQIRNELKNDEIFSSQTPLVMDRLSRLYLQEREVDEYLNLAAALITQFPAYPRAPAIELESLCVRALRDAHPEPEYLQGALYAPVYLIEHLRHARRELADAKREIPRLGTGPDGDDLPAETRALPAREEGGLNDCDALLDAVGQLCRKHQGAPTGALLDYHYAWMLDAAGKRDQAIKVIARVSCREPGDSKGEDSPLGARTLPAREERGQSLPRTSRGDGGDTPDQAIALPAGRPHEDVLREYAIIQHAIMLAERGDYRDALQLLATLPTDGDKTLHVSQLAESVIVSIQTLKREVPTDETSKPN